MKKKRSHPQMRSAFQVFTSDYRKEPDYEACNKQDRKKYSAIQIYHESRRIEREYRETLTE